MSTCPALVHRGHVHLSRLCPLGCPRVVPSIPTRPDPTRIKTLLVQPVSDRRSADARASDGLVL